MVQSTLLHLFAKVFESIGLLACLIYPGLIVSRLLFPKAFRANMSWAARLPIFVAFSLCLISLVQVLAFASPSLLQWTDILIVLFCVMGMGIEIHMMGWKGSFQKLRHEILPLVWPPAFLGVLSLIWAQFLKVPGPISAGYGDLPSYYRIAHNFALGVRPLIDFRIGDYLCETYTIPIQFPIPTLLTTFLTLAFSDKTSGLNLICAWSGAMSLLLSADIVAKKLTLSRSWISYLVMVIMAAGTVSFHAIMGAVVFPAILLVLAMAWTLGEVPALGKSWAILLTIFFAVFAAASRPESAVLVSLAMIFVALQLIFRRLKHPQIIAAVTFSVMTTLGIYQILPKIHPSLTHSYSYLRYDDKAQQFSWAYPANYDINAEFIFSSLGIDHKTSYNSEIHQLIRNHPIAFASFTIRNIFWRNSSQVWLCPYLALSLFMILLSLGTRNDEWSYFLFPMMLFPIVLSMINHAFSDRHLLLLQLLFPPAFSAMLSPWIRRPSIDRLFTTLNFSRLKHAVFGAFLFFGLIQIWPVIAEAKTAWNSHFDFIIEKIRPHVTSESALLATNYPQLYAHALNTKTVGNILIFETLTSIVRKYQPDFILLDNARRDHIVELSRFNLDAFPDTVAKNYELVSQDSNLDYVLLHRLTPRKGNQIFEQGTCGL